MVAISEVINAGMVCGRWYYGSHVGSHNHALPCRSSRDVHVVPFLDAADHRPEVTGWIRTCNQRKAKDCERYLVFFAPWEDQIVCLHFASSISIARAHAA